MLIIFGYGLLKLINMKEIISNFRKELRTQRNVLVYKRISEYIVLIGVPIYYAGRHEIWYVNDKSSKTMYAFAANGRAIEVYPWSALRFYRINYFGYSFDCDLILGNTEIIKRTFSIDRIKFLQKFQIRPTNDLLNFNLTNISVNCLKKYKLCQSCISFKLFYIVYTKYSGNVDEIIKFKPSMYVLSSLLNYDVSLPELLRMIKVASEDCYVYTYLDYLRMRKDLLEAGYKIKCPLAPTNKPTKYWHDYILSIYCKYTDQIQAHKLQNAQQKYIENYYDKAKAFEYKNDQYTIVACKELVELQIEGRSLNHCVGSYVDSVSEGKEYILFLRKCDNPEIPYFTLDLTPEKELRQAHGKCNCNVPEELRPFIKQWAHKFNINISHISSQLCHL